jgi:prepilin-type N-terminal cleavage/methylation domain-containing protein
MRNRRRSRKPYRPFWQRGFTLIEMIVIVAVVGILAAIAAPSFTSMLDAMKVDQAVVSLRTSLQETQRQSIRDSQVCTVEVPNGRGNGHSKGKGKGNSKKNSNGSVNCVASDPEISEDVDLASNLQSPTSTPPSSPSPDVLPTETIPIAFNPLGSADFSISSNVQPPATPSDPSGKVVAFITEKPQVKMKCVAISSTLGLTRIGTYTGSTVPSEITDTGVCTALDWTQQ